MFVGGMSIICLLVGCPGSGSGGGETVPKGSSNNHSTPRSSVFVPTDGSQGQSVTTWEDNPPSIVNISPVSGARNGGTVVTIRGVNLGQATQVFFGGIRAETLQIERAWEEEATLQCLTPTWSGRPGAVDVLVATPGGSATLPGGFSYYAELVDFAVEKDEGLVTLTWTLAQESGENDEILIYRGSQVLATLPGDAETYVYEEAEYGLFRLSAVLVRNGERSLPVSGMVGMGRLIWDPVDMASGYLVYVYPSSVALPERADYSLDVFSSTEVSLGILYHEGLLNSGEDYTFRVSTYMGPMISALSQDVKCIFHVEDQGP